MSRGRPRSVSDKVLLDGIDDIESPVVTAKLLSKRVGLTRQAVHKRLTTLHHQDKLCKAKLNERVVVWWRPD